MSPRDDERLEHLVHEISAGVSSVIGEDFFRLLTTSITAALDVEYAVIVESASGDAGSLRSIARSRHGEIAENISYALAGTPCEKALKEGTCTVIEGVRAQFPDFDLLEQIGVESYSSAQLVSASGEVLGLILVMDTEPLKDPELVQAIIMIFAARAAAELERAHSEETLRDSEQRHRTLVESAPVCIHEIDASGCFLSINPAGLRIVGVRCASKLTGTRYVDIVAPWDRERVKRLLGRAFKGRAAESELTWLVNGDPRTITVTFVPLREPDGRIPKLLGYSQDITEQKRAEQRLEYMAKHDALTGLPNRGLFLDRLTSGIKRARRNNDLLALLYVDLNRFKPVNDEHGHEAGDRVLEAVAERMQRAVREMDTVARLGGDEFAIILEVISTPGDADAVAAKLSGAIEEPIHVQGREVHLGASTGIAIYPEDGTVPADLLRKADAAMYRDKRAV